MTTPTPHPHVDPWDDPTDPAYAYHRDYLHWLIRTLDSAHDQTSAAATAWADWAAALAALTATLPALPLLRDTDGVDGRAVDQDGIDPATLRAALTAPIRAADHYAAVYTRHAHHLDDALADAVENRYPPPRDGLQDPTRVGPGDHTPAPPATTIHGGQT